MRPPASTVCPGPHPTPRRLPRRAGPARLDARVSPVELEHRLDGYGEAADQMRQIFDSPMGWVNTLEEFAKAVG